MENSSRAFSGGPRVAVGLNLAPLFLDLLMPTFQSLPMFSHSIARRKRLSTTPRMTTMCLSSRVGAGLLWLNIGRHSPPRDRNVLEDLLRKLGCFKF